MRQNILILLFAAVFVILAMGCALLRGRKALLALLMLVALTTILLATCGHRLTREP